MGNGLDMKPHSDVPVMVAAKPKPPRWQKLAATALAIVALVVITLLVVGHKDPAELNVVVPSIVAGLGLVHGAYMAGNASEHKSAMQKAVGLAKQAMGMPAKTEPRDDV